MKKTKKTKRSGGFPEGRYKGMGRYCASCKSKHRIRKSTHKSICPKKA